MPIRYRLERDGQGIVLSRIPSMAEALNLRAILAEKGIAATVAKPGGPSDFRVFLASTSVESFEALAAGLDVELMY